MPATRVTLDNCQLLGEGLDHPESVCVAPDGTLYAGGEAGQLYRITPSGEQHVIGSTGGFLLGVTLDGNGGMHACDIGNKALMHIASTGEVTCRTRAAGDRKFETPNHSVFLPDGRLLMSDSGDYWQQTTGTGYIALIAPDNGTSVFHPGPFRFANGVALHPSGEWLYIAQSTAANIVRIPLELPDGPIEVTHQLPAGTIPDGLAFAADGRLVIGCYKPDAILVGHPDGGVETLFEDPTGELLSRPTNIAIGNGKVYAANLGGWHITALDTDLTPAQLHLPRW